MNEIPQVEKYWEADDPWDPYAGMTFSKLVALLMQRIIVA
jgi:hypothetical protein